MVAVHVLIHYRSVVVKRSRQAVCHFWIPGENDQVVTVGCLSTLCRCHAGCREWAYLDVVGVNQHLPVAGSEGERLVCANQGAFAPPPAFLLAL